MVEEVCNHSLNVVARGLMQVSPAVHVLGFTLLVLGWSFGITQGLGKPSSAHHKLCGSFYRSFVDLPSFKPSLVDG